MNFSEMTRYEDANFNPMDQTNDIEFNREWGIDTLVAGNELLNQAHMDFSPAIKQTRLTFGGDVGRISRGTDFSSGRYAGSYPRPDSRRSDALQIWIPSVDYHATLVDSKDAAFQTSAACLRKSASPRLKCGNSLPVFG